ncbi:hypothetical protein ANN_18525 [Periplaneta americana]|uniref:Uncharacterized protein n=1 Tax=Periplaneta americana TaxID=6978 RepID=A0ABQ8SQA0_PERAM|nr:hypothetical protein ANN_18525 [Periplaneta americana]
MDVPIPAPAECEVRSVIKFLNAQGIAPIEIDRQLYQVYRPNVMSKQMDGPPPHWFNDVRTTLDNVLPGRWIGRGGPIAWPPRSLDLTPLDFFLWGNVKNKVYATAVRGLRDFRERIIEAIESIPEDMLQRAWQEIVLHLDIVTVTAGTHVDVW